MPTLLRPNTELVAIAWLKTLAELPSDQIGTTLPGNKAAWAATGFVQVAAGVGGSPDHELPVRRPVVQLDCWACNLNSQKPPKGKAYALAESIVNATWPFVTVGVTPAPGNYGPAKILEAIALTEPRHLPSDVAGYARVTLDVQIDWVAL